MEKKKQKVYILVASVLSEYHVRAGGSAGEAASQARDRWVVKKLRGGNERHLYPQSLRLLRRPRDTTASFSDESTSPIKTLDWNV